MRISFSREETKEEYLHFTRAVPLGNELRGICQVGVLAFLDEMLLDTINRIIIHLQSYSLVILQPYDGSTEQLTTR